MNYLAFLAKVLKKRVIQVFGLFYSDLADFDGQFGRKRHRQPDNPATTDTVIYRAITSCVPIFIFVGASGLAFTS